MLTRCIILHAARAKLFSWTKRSSTKLTNGRERFQEQESNHRSKFLSLSNKGSGTILRVRGYSHDEAVKIITESLSESLGSNKLCNVHNWKWRHSFKISRKWNCYQQILLSFKISQRKMLLDPNLRQTAPHIAPRPCSALHAYRQNCSWGKAARTAFLCASLTIESKLKTTKKLEAGSIAAVFRALRRASSDPQPEIVFVIVLIALSAALLVCDCPIYRQQSTAGKEDCIQSTAWNPAVKQGKYQNRQEEIIFHLTQLRTYQLNPTANPTNTNADATLDFQFSPSILVILTPRWEIRLSTLWTQQNCWAQYSAWTSSYILSPLVHIHCRGLHWMTFWGPFQLKWLYDTTLLLRLQASFCRTAAPKPKRLRSLPSPIA